jgi:hypothetical protein
LTPADLPPIVVGKKRIGMYGDSLLIDDEIWGWSHHLGYKIANDQMPFEIVNLARTGGVIASPAIGLPNKKS